MPVAATAFEVYVSEAVPTTVGSVPKLTANTNPSNTPPATGAITVPQSPRGAVVTNTGRTVEATYTYMTVINKLNVGTTPPPAKN